MGWVGVVATLIASTCFLLHRYPPASWRSESPRPSRAESDQDERPLPAQAKVERRIDDAHSSPKNEATEIPDREQDGQATPKVSASNVPSLEVPSLRLDSDTFDQKPTMNNPVYPLHKTSTGSTVSPSPLPTTTIMATTTTDSMPPPPTISNTSLMPPPPPPPRMRPPPSQAKPSRTASLTAGRYPPRPNQVSGHSSSTITTTSTLSPPPSAAATLRGSPSSRVSGSSLAPTPLLKPSKKSSQKVILEPGYSPLDWAALTSKPDHNLRGANLPPTLIRVTPSMLKAQNGRKGTDAWTSYQGRVFNITPYLPFHPGGKGELLRGAGKDSAKLFLEIHPWVNWDAILGECLVGILVSENEEMKENQLDAMD